MKQTNLSSIYHQNKHHQASSGYSQQSFAEDVAEPIDQVTQIKKNIANKGVAAKGSTKASALTQKKVKEAIGSAAEVAKMLNQIKGIVSEQSTMASTVEQTKRRVQAPPPVDQQPVDQKPRAQTRRSRSRSRKTAATLTSIVKNEKKRKIDEVSNAPITEEMSLSQSSQDTKRRKLNEMEEIKEQPMIEMRESRTEQSQIDKKPHRQSSKSPLNESILASLSQNTLKIIRGLNNKPQVNAPLPEVQEQPQKKSAKRTPVQLQNDFSFNQIPVMETPPQSKSKNNMYSDATRNVIADLLNDPQVNRQQPKEPRISYEELKKEEFSARFKYSDLIQVTRELVMPAHYKNLLDIARFLDNSLTYIKGARRNTCSFVEIKNSIEKSIGKQFQMSHFGQLLTVVPEHYTYKWDTTSSDRTPPLLIDFAGIQGETPNQGELDNRQKVLKQKLLEITKQHHDAFLQQLLTRQSSTSVFDQSDIQMHNYNAFEAKAWHHRFNPHDVPPIEAVQLVAPVKVDYKRSQSVHEFLDRSNMQKSLVRQALEKSVMRPQEQQPTNEAITDEMRKKCELIMQKTGLSMQTALHIVVKEHCVKQNQETVNQTMIKEGSQKKLQQLSKVSEMIRSTMNYRGKTTLAMKDLVQALNDNQRGQFQSQSQIQEHIEEVCQLVPEWASVKTLGNAKFVKVNSQVSSQQVQQMLKDRIK